MLFLVQDGHGHGQLIGLCLLAGEERQFSDAGDARNVCYKMLIKTLHKRKWVILGMWILNYLCTFSALLAYRGSAFGYLR